LNRIFHLSVTQTFDAEGRKFAARGDERDEERRKNDIIRIHIVSPASPSTQTFGAEERKFVGGRGKDGDDGKRKCETSQDLHRPPRLSITQTAGDRTTKRTEGGRHTEKCGSPHIQQKWPLHLPYRPCAATPNSDSVVFAELLRSVNGP